MTAAGILFLLAFVAVVVGVECRLQKMTFKTWPPFWLPYLLILIGGCWMAAKVASGHAVSWATVLISAGIAVLFLIDRRGRT